MLRTRLWMGAILIALAAGVLVVDQRLPPWFPFLFVLAAALGLAACHELLQLLSPPRRPKALLCHLGVFSLIAANWVAACLKIDPWHLIAGVFAGVILAAFLVEMATFKEPGDAVTRIALTIWIAGYLGLLTCFFAQLRWLLDPRQGTVALALAIFVPKMGDTGAYFTGRLLGRHKMSPVLSPKKTWEGAAGGLAASVATTIGINRLAPEAVLAQVWMEVGFGLTVSVVGLLGDLAESLIKRDCGHKDASQLMPGFGGVLDVVDAILFAAPVAYLWFRLVH